jgi:hypothetical protein
MNEALNPGTRSQAAPEIVTDTLGFLVLVFLFFPLLCYRVIYRALKSDRGSVR